MPKIAEIERTPNPNAMKFVLKEPLTWGITRSYENAEQAKDDPLAAALFEIEHVTNVFYVDHWITVTQDGGADWQELMRKLAVPIREAPAAERAVGAATRRGRRPLRRSTQALTDGSGNGSTRSTSCSTSRCGPYLQGDGGDLYVVGLEGNTLDGALPGRVRQLPELDLAARSPASRAWCGRSSPTWKFRGLAV